MDILMSAVDYVNMLTVIAIVIGMAIVVGTVRAIRKPTK